MPSTPDPADLTLPEGTRLVHIGPPKTGTTSLQGAFHRARGSLLDQGVRYAGRARHSRYAVYAALRRPAYRHLAAPPPPARWQALVEEIEQAPEARVILSSEILTDGDLAAVERVVRDLDPRRVHVVVTLRPLARILASQWQQEVRGGQRAAYDRWLADVFEGRSRTARHFWHRHRHDRLIARWADQVGTDRVTVVVVDDRDHGMILRAFEGLLGLREGTLVEERDGANRSMSFPEVEAVRAFNVVAHALPVGPALRHRLSRLVRRLAVLPDADPREPRLETPQWANDRAVEVASEMVAAIAASGVRVIGDLESLAAPQRSTRDSPAPPRGADR